MQLFTERLLLRQWLDTDLAPFAELNADGEVMRYFPARLDQAESNALAAKIRAGIEERGWGPWAVEIQGEDRFIGFVGLNPVRQLPIPDKVEVAWRLRREAWGRGYASEAATAALFFAFNTLKLDSVASFTSLSNARSIAVMQRLGMVDSGQNFIHPAVDPASELAEHVLYRISRAEFEKRLE